MTRNAREVIGVVFISAILFVPIYLGLEKHNRNSNRRYAGYGRRSDLKQIGLAMHLYCQSYNEFLPPTLSILYPGFISDPRVLASPGEIEENEERESWSPQRYHYLYEGSSVSLRDVPVNLPLVINSFIAGDEVYYAILFADGHVEPVYGSKIGEILNRTKKWRSNHGNQSSP